MRRKAQAARLESHIGTASKGQPKAATTSLRCYNVTDNSIFVEGLQMAGLKVVPRPLSNENDPNQLVLGVQSRAHAHHIVNSLHGCTLEGRKMHINIIDKGTVRAQEGQLPKGKWIRSCILDAFYMRVYKEDRAPGALEYALARPKDRTAIMVPEVATKRQKANKDLTKNEGGAVAMEIVDTERDKSKGLGEEQHEQKGEEERGGWRDDSFRHENPSTQRMEIGRTQSDLRGERSQIQDTACESERSYGSIVITSTRSSTPEDMLSALLASLDDGKDAAKGFDTVDNLI